MKSNYDQKTRFCKRFEVSVSFLTIFLCLFYIEEFSGITLRTCIYFIRIQFFKASPRLVKYLQQLSLKRKPCTLLP